MKQSLQIVETKHEARQLYRRFFDFWVRDGVSADQRDSAYFPDWGRSQHARSVLLGAIDPPEGRWQTVQAVWRFLKRSAKKDPDTYEQFLGGGSWPGIDDFAAVYQERRHVPWVACFSRGHLFSLLLGVCGFEPWAVGVASAKYSATGKHVYTGVYVDGRWWYLDPGSARPALGSSPESIAGVNLTTYPVDYQYPSSWIPLPGAGFSYVPMLDK